MTYLITLNYNPTVQIFGRLYYEYLGNLPMNIFTYTYYTWIEKMQFQTAFGQNMLLKLYWTFIWDCYNDPYQSSEVSQNQNCINFIDLTSCVLCGRVDVQLLSIKNQQGSIPLIWWHYWSQIPVNDTIYIGDKEINRDYIIHKPNIKI